MPFIVAGMLIVASVGLLFLCWHWINNVFQGKLFYYRLFKLGSLSKKTSVDQNGWTNGETELCKDFKKFIPAKNRAEFENYKEYLRKAGESGRTPLPFWMIFLIGLLIAAEGMGFSFMLGTFIAPEGTADTYLMLMLGIVFTLCVILGINMHAAGQQLYKRQLIVNCRRDWQETSSGDNKPFKTREVSLNTDQRIDDDDPFYTQVVNRVGTHSSLWMVYVAIFAIIVIAGGSTYMRAKGLEKSRADETLGKTAATTNSTAGNPFASKSPDGFPADVVAANDKAAAKGLAESRDAGTAEAYTAFVILAVIFVITQIVAIYSGAKWGFAAKESESAFKSTRGYASWTQVEEIRSRYIEPIEELMGALHAKYQGGNRKMTSHTVRQFLEVPTSSEAGDNSQVAQSLVYRSASNDAPVNKTTESTFAIETHLKAIAALLAIEEKQNYVLRLPSGIKEKVIDAIRARKEADAKAKEVKDLENLF